ncbi:hypothetical protein DNG97_24765 [Vibrio parahaemolyticus]|nr:hypothetical protein [Vibrio parahaemolyticus]EHK2861090.1 hypothetical protein [Vibrio parahaemolyticus]
MSTESNVAFDYIELVKVAGPYVVAISTVIFSYFQALKLSSTQEKIAQVSKDKDLEIAAIQKRASLDLEEYKLNKGSINNLKSIYCPLYAKIETLYHNYYGALSRHSSSKQDYQQFLLDFVIDDYNKLTVESRKLILANSIAQCQLLKDHKLYELAVKLDCKVTEFLAAFNLTDNCNSSEVAEKLECIYKDFGLLYVSFFYRLGEEFNLKS